MTPTLTILLPYPIKAKDRDYTEIVLSVPRVGWRLDAEQFLTQGAHPAALTRYSVRLVAKCAGVSEPVVHELENPTFDMAWAWISDQLTGGIEAAAASPGEVA